MMKKVVLLTLILTLLLTLVAGCQRRSGESTDAAASPSKSPAPEIAEETRSPAEYDNANFKWLTVLNPDILPDVSIYEMALPVKLIKGEQIVGVGVPVGELDIDAISDYEELVKTVREVNGIPDDFLYIPDNLIYKFEEGKHLNVEYYTKTELDKLAVEKKIYDFRFYNQHLGVPIIDMWFLNQGILVRYPYSPYTDDSDTTFSISSNINTFTPSSQLIKPMPISQAILLAEAPINGSEKSEVVYATLCYTAVPDVFGDEDYHLCWRISSGDYRKYYINCKTGARWCDSNE